MKYPQFRDKSKLQVHRLSIFPCHSLKSNVIFTVLTLHLFLATSLAARLVGWQALLQNELRELQVCKYFRRESGIHYITFFIYDLARYNPDRLFSAAEALFRRTGSGSGHNREHTKHRSLLESLMPSKAVRSFAVL